MHSVSVKKSWEMDIKVIFSHTVECCDFHPPAFLSLSVIFQPPNNKLVTGAPGEKHPCLAVSSLFRLENKCSIRENTNKFENETN